MNTTVQAKKLVPTDMVEAWKPTSGLVKCLLNRPERVIKRGVMNPNMIAGHLGKSSKTMIWSGTISAGLKAMQTELPAISRMPNM